MASTEHPTLLSVERFLAELRKNHMSITHPLPLKDSICRFADQLLGFLFPQLQSHPQEGAASLEDRFASICQSLAAILEPLEKPGSFKASETLVCFREKLPSLYEAMRLDAEAIWQGDPAAVSVDEVILTYPGFLAIAYYRIGHLFLSCSVPLLPRVVTEYGHQRTGIDIHPGATIGRSFCIDHGTGVVIGETAILGNSVKLYQGVTLGGLSINKGLAQTKRHPTIEDNVTIYANATILGGETVVGAHSIIGGNVWLTHSVPPYSTVYNTHQVTVRERQG